MLKRVPTTSKVHQFINIVTIGEPGSYTIFRFLSEMLINVLSGFVKIMRY